MENEPITPPTQAPPRRSRLGLSVRALMAVVLVLAVWLGWIANRAHVQRDAVAAIRRAGGSVGFDTDWTLMGPFGPPKGPRGPIWMRRWLGPDYFDTATSVHFFEPGPQPKAGGDEVLKAAARLPDLQALSICYSDATDVGAEGLGRLTGLRSLDLRLNRMTVRAVKDFRSLTELRELKIATIPLRDEDMAFLRAMPKLESLQIPGRTTTLTDAWLSNVEGLINLKYLQLSDIPITAAGLPRLRNLANLRVLRLHGAKVDDLKALVPLKELGSLGLYGNPIEDDDLAALKDLPRLYSLELSKTGITDLGLLQLRRIPMLSELDLDGTKITDAGLIELGKIPKLRSISIRDTSITSNALDAFRKAHPMIAIRR
jgi:hypothetical protein